MNNKQAIEVLEKLIKTTKAYQGVKQDSNVSVYLSENAVWLSDEVLQALDLAIESLHHFDYQDLFKKQKKANEELIKMLVDNGIIELEDKA